MKVKYLYSDIVSTLPPNIIENILTLMPIKDALRTSILSRKWRYWWTGMPKLAFDYRQVEVPSNSQNMEIHRLVNAIFHVLLLHNGPIQELSLNLGELEMVAEFDPILLYLSRINNLKFFTLINSCNYYKLPSSFFSLQGLEFLKLTGCEIELPSTFNGFSRLRSLLFFNVKMTPQILQRFLSNCPLLDHFCLDDSDEDVPGENKFTFGELLQCAPLIETLQISKYHMKYLAAGGMSQKLPTSLVHLKFLFLDVCLMEQDEISSAFCMIRSSPNLENIIFLMYDNEKLPLQQISMNFLDLQYHSNLNLDHLTDFTIEGFSNLDIECDFVKLIMAKSPVLKHARIELDDDFSVDEEVKMLRDLIQRPYPHASPSAQLVIDRPKPSS